MCRSHTPGGSWSNEEEIFFNNNDANDDGDKMSDLKKWGEVRQPSAVSNLFMHLFDKIFRGKFKEQLNERRAGLSR